MTVSVPSTKEIAENIVNSIDSKLGQTTPMLPKAVFRVIAFAVAGAITILYKVGLWTYSQMFLHTADLEALTFWAEMVGLQQTPATQAVLDVEILGEDGITVPSGYLLLDSETDLTFTVITDTIISEGKTTAKIIANTSGTQSNLPVDKVLVTVVKFSGLRRESAVVAVDTYAQDEESVDSFRNRIIARYATPPQGGSIVDYTLWGTEPTSVSHVYPYSGDVEGTVEIYVENLSPTGVATSADVALVEESVNRPDRRPMTAKILVSPVRPVPSIITILGLSDFSTNIETALTTAITAYFKSCRPFITGIDTTDSSKIQTNMLLLTIASALVPFQATFNSVKLALENDPAVALTSYTLGKGEKMVLAHTEYEEGARTQL